jgi:hypothetical protein
MGTWYGAWMGSIECWRILWPLRLTDTRCNSGRLAVRCFCMALNNIVILVVLILNPIAVVAH